MAKKLSHSGIPEEKAFKGDKGDYGPEKTKNRKGTYNTEAAVGTRSGKHDSGISRKEAYQGDYGKYGPENKDNRKGSYNEDNVHGARSGTHDSGVPRKKAYKGDYGVYGPEKKKNRKGTYNEEGIHGTRSGIRNSLAFGQDTVLTDSAPAPTTNDISNKNSKGISMGNPTQGEGWAPTSNLVGDRYNEKQHGELLKKKQELEAKGKDTSHIVMPKSPLFTNNEWNKIRKQYMKIYGSDLNIFDKIYRFGYLNPADAISNTREYLFFTKPALWVYKSVDGDGESPAKNGNGNYSLRKALKEIPFWKDMIKYHPDVLFELSGEEYGAHDSVQRPKSLKSVNNNLLSNQVSSTLDVPGTDAVMSETAANKYGVSISYRGSSEASDDNFDFSLEFKDTRNLDVYYFFKAYEEYETLKHHGVIGPPRKYIEQKILHDQFAIYKFIVDEDMETIVYYCKYYGVTPKSLPRDIFSSNTFENGIVYSIGFHAQFFEDMDPRILYDFNHWMNKSPYMFWNVSTGGVNLNNLKRELTGTLHPVDENGEYDYTGARCAYVMRGTLDNKYKLLWI